MRSNVAHVNSHLDRTINFGRLGRIRGKRTGDAICQRHFASTGVCRFWTITTSCRNIVLSVDSHSEVEWLLWNYFQFSRTIAVNPRAFAMASGSSLVWAEMIGETKRFYRSWFSDKTGRDQLFLLSVRSWRSARAVSGSLVAARSPELNRELMVDNWAVIWVSARQGRIASMTSTSKFVCSKVAIRLHMGKSIHLETWTPLLL